MHLLAVPGFTASGHRPELVAMQRHMRERVWQAAHVVLTTGTLDVKDALLRF